ncbi:MAG: hypothetical protein Q9P90_16485 [candidate division KSB1 bacterium]|nr:hypothetical protein [candidate division KSB1 bacterium]
MVKNLHGLKLRRMPGQRTSTAAKIAAWTFTKNFTVAEHDRYQPVCEMCQSKNVEQVLSDFFAQTSKKS